MTQPHDIAIADQVEAAQREVDSILADACNSLTPAAPWMHGIARRAVEILRQGYVRCRHLTSPRPFLTATWRPGEIWCIPCEIDAPETPPGPCDKCGADASTETVHITQIGIMMCRLRLCQECENN